MGKTLIIVESPKKAKTLEDLLDKNKYIVMASKGHIEDLAKGGKWGIGVDIQNNFKPHYILMDDKVSVLDAIMKVAKTCDQILLSSDPDREGSAIAYTFFKRLGDLNVPMKRMVFHKITKAKVEKAIQEAGEIDLQAVHSQQARRILDRIVGFNASPFLMNYFSSNLSSGRVQSVVVRMIVDREREIENFVPEIFWTIQTSLAKNGKDNFTAKLTDKIVDINTANIAVAALDNQEYIVSEVISREEEKKPFPPLITSTLQRAMSKEHHISPEKTMECSQNLFSNGIISYHRTDAPVIGEETLKDLRKFLADNNYQVPNKAFVYEGKDEAQGAHECISPINIDLLPKDFYSSDPDEKLVYETIWKYFVASQMMPAVYDTLSITASPVNNSKLKVKASGKALKSQGFLEVLNSSSQKEKMDLPYLKKGDKLQLFGNKPVKLEKKQTQPPGRFSDDKIIKSLEDKNIGRPSTYAELLSKITSRNYVEKQGAIYRATDLGKKITDVLIKYFSFMEYSFTAKLEKQLDDIGAGKIDYLDVLKNFYSPFKQELNKAYLSNGGSLCEKCNSHMVVKSNKSSGKKFSSCSNFPHCKNIKNIEEVVLAIV